MVRAGACPGGGVLLAGGGAGTAALKKLLVVGSLVSLGGEAAVELFEDGGIALGKPDFAGFLWLIWGRRIG